MNFEQNFSPLDPNSEEYQSVDSFGQELDPLAPKKPKTIPGTSVPIGVTGIPVTKVDKPFTQIENAIRSAKQADKEYQGLLAKKGGASSIYGEAPGDEIERNKQFSSALNLQSNELLKKYTPEINKPIDEIISSGKWEEYITEYGAFNDEKARRYFDYVVKKNGGDTYLKELMVSKLENVVLSKKNEKDVKPFLKEEITKTGLNLDKDGNVDFSSIIGTENLKAGQEAKLKSIAPAQFSKLQLIENKSQKEVTELFNASTELFKLEEAKFNSLKAQIQGQLTAGQITQEEAQNAIDTALSGINQVSDSLNIDFQKSVRAIRVKNSAIQSRISKEIGAMSSGMTLEDIISGLPKDKQKEVRTQVEDAKSKVNKAYENAYSKLYSSRNEGKKAQESIIGLGGLAGKSFLSGWNNGLASLGGYLNMNGADNSFTDWLREHSTTGKELAPAQYEWSGKEWYKRGISSAMQSTGMSLPTMAPTLAVTAAGTALGVPAVGLAAVNAVLGYLGERSQNSFEVYNKELSKSGNPNDALRKAETFERMSVSELPFHLLGGLADVKLFQLGASATKSAGKGVKSIVTDYAKGFGGELLEEYPTELLQNYNQEKLDGYKGSLFEYGASKPELFLDTLVSTLGQGSVFAGAGKVFGAFTASAPESRIQFYTDMIQKNGIDYAKTVAKKYYDSGLLDGNTASAVVGEIDAVSKIHSDLLESGLDENAAKLYVAMHYQSKNLSSKIEGKKDSVMGTLARLQLSKTESQMKELANGNLPYVVMDLPGGEKSSRVISLQDFNTLTDTQKNNAIQASNSISVINDEDANASLQEQKQQLGNTPNAPQGLFTNNIRPAQATSQEITEVEQIGNQEVKFQSVMPGKITFEKSEEGKGDPSISSRNPIVTQAAQELKSGKISNEEYRATVSENSPILPITRFFEPANDNEMQNALSSDKKEQINQPLQDGKVVGLRLDIPAYKNNNTWVVSVHDGNTNSGKVLSYNNVARITNVTFGVEPKGALAIATGTPKATIGRMFGEWQNIEGNTSEEKGNNAKAIIQDINNNPEWVQVGMNPFRHSYFYDRSSQVGRPVTSATEVVQVGGLVYAKNPEYGNWTDESYEVKAFLDSKGVPVQFQTQNKLSEGQTESIVSEMNNTGGNAVDFSADDNLNINGKSDIKTFKNREGIVQQPKVVSISDFNGMPMMVTISDELTTGSIVNPITGNTINNLKGGLGFNYSQDNTEYAWAYTDEKTSTDTFNAALDLYNSNKEFFDKAWADGRLPKNHIPVAIVKMGLDAINSNEAIFRVLLDNLNTLPKKNLVAAYKAYSEDVSSQIKRLEAKSKLTASERNELNGYKNIRDKYLKENKTLLDVIKNISQLNINTRPLVTDRITSGEVGLLTATNRLTAGKPAAKALMNGLTKEDIKKIHLGYIAEPLREQSIKNVPQRHVIGFVGIDISSNGPIAVNTHPNYPFALKGMGLGVVENTAHLASVMPTAYGNIINKINDSVSQGKDISTGQAASRAMPSGLANAIFKNKTLSSLDNLSKLIGFLNLSFPNVTFFTDEQSFQDVMSSDTVREYLKDGEVVYGLTTDGKIYLNPKIATSNTAIHEMGHIWVDYIENMNKELFSKGMSLVEGTKELELSISKLGDTIAARKEALAMLIGNKGETITDAALKSKFKEYLVALWKYLQEKFPSLRNLNQAQIENLTLEQFIGGAAKDILSGKPISEVKSEYISSESQFQKGEKPDWFDDTPGSQKIKVTQDFIKENPAFVDAIKNDLLLINKKKWTGTAQGLKDAINELVDSGTFNLDAQQLRNAIVRVYKATPKSKANISKTIAMAESIEKMNSLFTDKAIEVNKQELKKSIVNNNEYNDAEKEIILGMIEDIIPENVFLFINESATDAKKSKDNYYEFSTNLLKSKRPSAFIHEVGHWGFFNILTPQERIEFFKYSAERFAKGEAKLEDEQVFGKPFKATREMPDGSIETATMQTNATEDFMEYFAEQFRQYYIENKITDAQFDTLFKKISLVLDKILDLFRKTGYNKELVKYFDKIIDARPKESAPIQEAQQETGIVKVEPAQPSTEVGMISPTGEIAVPIEEQQPSGLPEKKKYSWEKGNDGKPQPGETMIKTSTGRYVAIETMNGQKMDIDRKLNEIKKAKPSLFNIINTKLRTAWLDNQDRVLRGLSEIGKQGQLVKAYLLTRNSASATATIKAEAAVKEIYGNMSKKNTFNINGAKFTEYELFNQVIGYQRVISIQDQMNQAYQTMLNSEIGSPEYNKSKKKLIDNNMIDVDGNFIGESLDVEFAMGNVTSTQAKALLYEIRESIGEDAFGKLMTASDKYSNHFNGMMKDRLDAGLISQDTYDYLVKFFYAPARYISDALIDPLLSLSEKTASYRQDSILRMRTLAGGTEKLNMSDYEGLLRAMTYASEYSISENRATNRFYNLVSENPAKFKEAGIRLGTKLVPIEMEGPVKFDVIDDKVKSIQEGKSPNPLSLPSGQKQLPYKGMQKAGEMGVKPYIASIDIEVDGNGNKFRVVQEQAKEGEDYIKTYFNGQRYDLIVPQWFADQWYNRNVKSMSALSFVGKITGANLLRVIATGINPVFGVAQLIPDTISAYTATLEERKLPILVDYPIFFAKTLMASKDIMRNSKDFQEAMQYGATTNFYNGGMVSFERGLLGKEDNSLEKVIEKWNVPGLKQYVMGSKRITETTEQMSKVALYKSIRDSKINQFKKDNNREPNQQEMEDIKIEAGAMARGTADFHRKGTWGGEINKIVPYLNAGIQVQRAVFSSAKANPKKALAYSMEFASYATLLTLSALGAGDDDELKEKKRKAYMKLSEFDRDNRVILYFVESQEKFVSIKIPDFLVPIHSLARRLTERIYLEGKTLTSKDAYEVTVNVADAFPLTQFANLEKVGSRNPLYSAIAKYKFNRDPYRQEEVVPYEEATKDYLEGAMVGKKQSSKVFQKAGELTKDGIPFFPEGISPARLEAATGSVPFKSNPLSGFAIFLAEAGTSEKALFEERYGKNTRDMVLKASGITDRYFKEGSKINQSITGLSIEETKDRGEFKNELTKQLLPKLDSALLTMSRPEAFKKVRTEFVKGDYQKLNPEQKEIARSVIEGELKSRVKNVAKDEMIGQIVKMNGSDAKIDGIVQTLNTIKVTDKSKIEFIRDLVDAGLVTSADLQKSLNVRGRKVKNNGEENSYYEPNVGFIRDEIIKYVAEKRAAKLK